jgi:hypothetical protein
VAGFAYCGNRFEFCHQLQSPPECIIPFDLDICFGSRHDAPVTGLFIPPLQTKNMIRALIIFALLFISQQAQAAEKLTFAFVYLCKAAAITEKTVNICSINYPGLAERGRLALASWQQRNANDAQRGTEICESEIRKLFPADAQLLDAEEQIEKLESDYFRNMESSFEKRGISQCLELLTAIEHVEGDLSRVFLK